MGVSIYATLAEAICINSTHRSVIGKVKIIKDGYESSAPVAHMIKCVPVFLFDASDPGSNLPYDDFLSPFLNLISHRKGICQYKLKK